MDISATVAIALRKRAKSPIENVHRYMLLPSWPLNITGVVIADSPQGQSPQERLTIGSVLFTRADARHQPIVDELQRVEDVFPLAIKTNRLLPCGR